ncbi:hypothetical protein ABD91_21025 [Lysinibacillus sphaericus]|uniref:hypothetical protein n=1 Tax=Lysinibacillus sphaericus TaxID=1421 RepID=UPI0018CC7BFC|nr:hypothetical protein [Lysinibacillus sphaericus]MBG9693224.1 hypothetical protein [Lysinibacillus sphaericus]
MWKRYRFKTKSTKDYRPLIFNPKYPWWCSGEGDGYVVIVAYLPEKDDLFKYWDDAYEVEYAEEKEITFTERFSKPDYYINE